MTENSLQKLSHILLSNKNIRISPNQTLTNFHNQLQDLNQQTVKAKLQACLFSLREAKKQIKNSKSQHQKNQMQNMILSINSNSKNKNLPQLPIIQKQKNKENFNQNNKILNESTLEGSFSNPKSFLKSNRSLNQFLNTTLSGPSFNKNILNQQKSYFNPYKTSQTMIKNIKSDKILSHNTTISSKFGLKLKQRIDNQRSLDKDKDIKKINIHPKVTKHLYESAQGKALPKQNKYFSNKIPLIDQSQIIKLGLYQSSNRYRKQMIVKQMQNLSPKIQKKELEFVKVCKQNELFLTRPKQLAPTQLDDFLKEQFVINQARPARYFQTIHTQDVQKRLKQSNQKVSGIKISQNSKKQSNQDCICEQAIQVNKFQDSSNNLIFLQIRQYQIVKNQSFIRFKVQNIQIWDQIQSLIDQIIRFLKQLKVTSCQFKASLLLQFWSGKRLSNNEIQKILKINRKDFINKKNHAINSVFNVCYARRKMKTIIKNKQKELGYMKWVCDRIIGIRSIKKQYQYKINKALEIHQKALEGNYTWDTEIYISSFSQNQFVRNTTQYMESFQNMFTNMWKQSSKHMILVIPTINSQILQIYQQKLKIKRSITLICPQVHQLFPVNMSLAGCLLFSYQALNKIKHLIEGKSAVIIPGKFSDPKYELLISQYLRAPLLASLKPKKDLTSQKQLFNSVNLSVLPYISIRPQSSIDAIIENFARLVISNKQINKWLFKINGQFGGRGLATFSITSSKVLKSILSSCKETIKPLEEYLRRNLKLKLKINFQNSLFMLGDYLQRLSLKGGIIQEQKQNAQSYEISFFIENKNSSYLVSCFKSFSVNHSNKAYIYEQIPNPKVSYVIPKLKSTLQKNQYLGYVSLNLLLAGNNIYGIQIKPYMTQLTCVEPFIKCIQSKRQLKLNLVNQNPKMSNQFISSTLRNDFISKRRQQQIVQNNSGLLKSRQIQNNRIPSQNSHLFSNINLSITQLQTLRHHIGFEYQYLFVPNIILTDVPIPKKAELLQTTIQEIFRRKKFDILNNNLVLYISNGLSLNLLFVGKDIKKLKKISIQTIRSLSQKTGALKIYCGKNQARDVFQFGDIIKAITQIQ